MKSFPLWILFLHNIANNVYIHTFAPQINIILTQTINPNFKMVQLNFRRCLLTSLLMFVGLNVWGDAVTFTYSDYVGQGQSSPGSAVSATKAEITIAGNKAYGKNGNKYTQFYAGNTITVTPNANVTISKIVITAASKSYNGGTLKASTGSVKTDDTTITWKGSATSAFTITNGSQLQMKEMVVTYSMQVTEGERFYKVTDASSLNEGDVIAIVNEEYTAAMSTTQETTFRASTTGIAINNGCLTASKYVQQLTLGKSGDYWTFYTGSGYLYAPSSSGSYLRTRSSVNENARATISFEDGNAIITFQGSSTHNLIKFNSMAKIFECFEASNTSTSYKSVQIYRKSTITLSVSNAGYATYYTDVAWQIPSGLEVGVVPSVDNTSLVIDWDTYNEGCIVPKKTGVILKNVGSYDVSVMESSVSAPTNNLLHGSVNESTTEVGDGYLYYKLANDSSKGIGFYWGATDGGAFTNGANKAYLALPASSLNTKMRGFSLSDDNATAIKAIDNVTISNNKVYDLTGREVKNPVKGIYIINGKKTIIK